MSMGKRIFISIISILMVVCVALIGWFLYIKFYAPEKLIENTYEVGLQTTDDDTRSFIEVSYYSNENQNGLECLDIKFNYLLDENQTAFASQGIQIIANDEDDVIDWGYYIDEDSQFTSSSQGHWYDFANKVTNYGFFGSYDVDEETASIINYASVNDYEDTTISSNPITDDTTFRIQLGEDLYLMKFKGTSDQYYSDANLYGSEYAGANWLGNRVYYDYYYYNNIYAFAYKIYQGLQSIQNGTSSSVIFEFGDMFNYYIYEDGQYTDTAIEDSTSVIANMKSYYSMLVHKSADGVQKASDSLFNCVNGNPTYNTTGDYTGDVYFTGREVVECDIFDFNLVEMSEDACALKLTEEFLNKNLKNKDAICLSIKIDKEILKQKGIDYFVFATDSGLENFTIFECYQIELVNGEIVRTEVVV